MVEKIQNGKESGDELVMNQTVGNDRCRAAVVG